MAEKRRKYKSRRELAAYGKRGDRVRVVVDTRAKRIVGYYRDLDGIGRKQSWGDTEQARAEAIAWAEGFHAERARMAAAAAAAHEKPPTTLRELWKAFETARFPHLREATQVSYAQLWRRWERYLGADFPADRTTLQHVDTFVAEALRAQVAVNQARQVLNVARLVYLWGQRRRLVRTNDLALHRWQQPKDAVVHEPGEYSAEEYAKLRAQVGPQDFKKWRIWAFLVLADATGMRARALRHLQWASVAPADEPDAIRWPGQYQKNGKDHVQPLSWDAVAALETARWWAAQAGYTGQWVLFAGGGGAPRKDGGERRRHRDEPWTYQAMWRQLRAIEKAAGVQHEQYRAAHGLRRKVVGDVIEATGDRMLGLEFVGDTDPKVLKSYDKRLTERVAAAGSKLEAARRAPTTSTNSATKGKRDA